MQGSLLVVDDNEHNRNMLHRRLQRYGYTVTEAPGGYQALALIAQQAFDLILLDVMMPDMDGLTVLKQLRQTYTATELPVIMVTVRDRSEDIVEALDLGANDYVTKPIDFPIALARIRTHLAHKRAEEALKQTRDAALHVAQQKADFLTYMSHEIRTPMNGVLGMTTLLLQTDLNDEQQELASIAHTSAEALLTLINDILDSAKLEAGKLLLVHAPFDLRAAVESVLDVVAEPAFAKHLDLVACCAPDLPQMVAGDAGRVRQILLNLVANAVKFTERGEVRLEVTLASRTATQLQVRFAVHDTGIGISSSDQTKLFQAFSQAEGATTSSLYGGTGLGLALSKQLVTLLGGEIGVQSVPGEGSVFWCLLPFEYRLSAETTAGFPPVFPGVRALVLEPHLHTRLMLQQYLSLAGIQNEAVADVAAALSLLQASHLTETPYDLVFLDGSLPDSESILLACQANGASTVTPPGLILLLPLGQARTAPSQATRAAAILTKPVKYAALYACVEQALQQRPSTVLSPGVP
ncbi:MAG: response regulator [Candidatus Tectimicrobiota bacterium]